MSLAEFGIPFQRAIIRLAMIDDAFCGQAARHLSPGFFSTEPLGWAFRLLKDHHATYSSGMTDTVLWENARRLGPEKQATYVPELHAVVGLAEVRDHEWVKAQLAEFVRRNIFASAHRESAELFNQGKADAAYDLMAKAHDDIRGLALGDVDRQWFFDELDTRQRRRVRASMDLDDIFSTGIRDLDRRTDGGVKIGEVWCVLAYAKRCKSTWLLNQAFNATRVHMAPTLVYNLEGSGKQWADKLDACFSSELYANVKRGRITPSLFREMHSEFLSLRRLLVIRTSNEWDTNVLDIEAEIAELRARGFRPRMLIVDYLDLLRARDRVESETAHQVAAARDLKRLTLKHELATWSAWQAQRPKPGAHEKEHIITSANVADAYAKVRIVDAYGSLNATDDEMNKNQMRVFWEAHRDASVTETYWLTNDISRMRMITASGVGVDPASMAAVK